MAFGKPAEIIGQYVSKGDQIHVRGRMQTRKWTDKDGQNRWTTEVVVNDFQFIGGKRGESEESAPADSGFDDDTPF